MNLPDVNVLVNAFRPDAPYHGVCREWLLGRIRDAVPLLLLDVVAAGFVRVVTHPRVFTEPAGTEDALDFLTRLMQSASVRMVSSSGGWWPEFAAQLAKPGISGNLVSDAHIAATAISHGCVVFTLDRDFRRFDAPFQLLLP